MKEAHRLQCFMPIGSILLTNNMGTAPGMWMKYKNSVIVSMPGVPSEMKYIFNNDLKDNSNYEYVKSQLDVDNFIDYTIAEMFFTNIGLHVVH